MVEEERRSGFRGLRNRVLIENRSRCRRWAGEEQQRWLRGFRRESREGLRAPAPCRYVSRRRKRWAVAERRCRPAWCRRLLLCRYVRDRHQSWQSRPRLKAEEGRCGRRPRGPGSPGDLESVRRVARAEARPWG